MEEALQKLKSDTRLFINCEDIAPILESAPQAIRNQANSDISALGFKVVKVGTRIKIPRQAFLNWLEV